MDPEPHLAGRGDLGWAGLGGRPGTAPATSTTDADWDTPAGASTWMWSCARCWTRSAGSDPALSRCEAEASLSGWSDAAIVAEAARVERLSRWATARGYELIQELASPPPGALGGPRGAWPVCVCGGRGRRRGRDLPLGGVPPGRRGRRPDPPPPPAAARPVRRVRRGPARCSGCWTPPRSSTPPAARRWSGGCSPGPGAPSSPTWAPPPPEELAGLSTEQVMAVSTKATPAYAGRVARELAQQVDPAAARRRETKAKAGRSVRLELAADGMAWLTAHLPAAAALAAYEHVDALAHTLPDTLDGRGRRCARHPVDGRQTGRRPHQPAARRRRHPRRHGHPTRAGPRPRHPRRPPPATDHEPPTGRGCPGRSPGSARSPPTPCATSSTSPSTPPAPSTAPSPSTSPAPARRPPRPHGPGPYQPPERLKNLLRVRHRTCVFPGCTRPSRRCELDHTLRHPDGPTCACNMAPLCKHHHHLKHHAPGWHLTNHGNGHLTWTTPTGRHIDVGEGPAPPGAQPDSPPDPARDKPDETPTLLAARVRPRGSASWSAGRDTGLACCHDRDDSAGDVRPALDGHQDGPRRLDQGGRRTPRRAGVVLGGRHADSFVIHFTTSASSVKGRTLQRDSRVALTVDDPHPPFAFVIVEGDRRAQRRPRPTPRGSHSPRGEVHGPRIVRSSSGDATPSPVSCWPRCVR